MSVSILLDIKCSTGSGKYLENLVKEKVGVKVRSIELNVCQRCSSAMLSDTDLTEAVNAGAYGVQAALKGETGKMITFNRHYNHPYELSYGTADVNNICNKKNQFLLSGSPKMVPISVMISLLMPHH